MHLTHIQRLLGIQEFKNFSWFICPHKLLQANCAKCRLGSWNIYQSRFSWIEVEAETIRTWGVEGKYQTWKKVREAKMQPGPKPPTISSCLALVESRPLSPPCWKHHCIFYVKPNVGPQDLKRQLFNWTTFENLNSRASVARDFPGPISKGNFFMKKQKQYVFLLSKNHCASSIIRTGSWIIQCCMGYKAHLNAASFIL